MGVDVDSDSLIVYASDTSPIQAARLLTVLLGAGGQTSKQQTPVVNHASDVGQREWGLRRWKGLP